MNEGVRIFSTPLDPVEEPPGGVDALGTLGGAERLADVLLPGFTVRMWRARLLTFGALAAEVAERVVRSMDGRAEFRLEARLGFERLFVTALACTTEGDPVGTGARNLRLPGSSLARAAWATKEPLTRANFLKGQSVNGPFGVMARLGGRLGLIDPEGGPGPKASDLLLAWARDEQLEGLLAEDRIDQRPGAAWMAEVVRVVVDVVGKGRWPGRGHKVWDQLSAPFRMSVIGLEERRIIGTLLDGAPTRRRVFDLLRPALRDYRAAWSASAEPARGTAERAVLWGRLHGDARRDDGTDREIAVATQAIEAFELGSARFLEGFDAVRWGLVRRGGRGTEAEVLAIPQVATRLSELSGEMAGIGAQLEAAIERLRGNPALSDVRLTEPLDRLSRESSAAVSPQALVAVILSRHERVQKQKGKGTWVDRSSGPRWLLMPGFGVDGDGPPRYRERYVHPFRIGNAYSILKDLGRVRFEDDDAEE